MTDGLYDDLITFLKPLPAHQHFFCVFFLNVVKYTKLGGGFIFFKTSPLFGEDFQFDWYFSNGLKPPTSKIPPFHNVNLYVYIYIYNI